MNHEKAAENDPDAPGSGLVSVADYKDKGSAADFVSHARAEAAKSAHNLASHLAEGVRGVAGDLAEKGGDAASAASARARSLAVDLEARARGNPLGAIAAAFAIGAVLGLLRRR